MKRRTRFLSFILSLVMLISSFNVVAYGGLVNSGGNPYNPATGSGSYTNKSHGYTTGYKMQLVFLDVEGLTAQTPPDEKREMIDAAWANATPDTVRKIGKPIYLSYGDSAKDTNYGFAHTDFEYGLGSVMGSYSRAITGTSTADTVGITVLTPDVVNNTLNRLNIASMGNSSSVKYSNSTMQMNDADFPILLGSKPHGKDLKSYFMTERTQAEIESDPDVNSPYYATSSFAAVVNYIATEAGQKSDNFIYFGRIKNKNGSVEKYDDLIPNEANCFELGRYKGSFGEYRLVVSDYWVCSSGVLPYTAFTLRDAAWMWTNSKYKGVVSDQTVYVKGLGVALRLEDDDIWGLLASEESDYSSQSLTTVMSRITNNYGGGLSFFSSSMMSGSFGQPNYIGSVVNVFLPGSLSGSDNSVKTASVEYIGPRSSDATSSAMMSGLIQLSQAASGMTVDNNIFTNGQLSQDVILNGTIKLPGVDKSNATSDTALSVLRALLDGAESDDTKITITEETREAIKQTIKDELGIDLSATGSGTKTGVNMQDVSLAVYLLSRFQQTGLEADGNGYEVWDTPGNRWRQILAYEGMLSNGKSKGTIESNESGAWSGPLGITANDLKNYTTNKNANFDTAGLGENKSKLKNSTAPSTSEGAQQAISADVLDNKQIGQITASDNWGNILGGSAPADGLVRVPVAMGTTQVYLDSTSEDDSVNIGKNQLPSTVATVFADVLNGIRSTGKTDGSAQQISLTEAANRAYKDKGLATDGSSQ